MSNIDTAHEAFDKFCEKNFGYTVYEVSVIDDCAPVASVRHDAKAFLGKDYSVNNTEAKEILEYLDGAEMFTYGNFRFVDANAFITMVVMVTQP